MKKWLIPLLVIGGLVLIAVLVFSGTYNSAVNKQENTRQMWANVESAYQRRNDLIDNLVNTVKGAADFERSTLTDVIEARAKATSVNVDAENLSEEQVARFQQAQGEVSSALSRLLVTVERYPQLRATQNFQQLQSQLEGTENRINVARNRYNEAATDYNSYIRRFPNNLIAGMYGFDRMPPFEAEAGAEVAPEVEFEF